MADTSIIRDQWNRPNRPTRPCRMNLSFWSRSIGDTSENLYACKALCVSTLRPPLPCYCHPWSASTEKATMGLARTALQRMPSSQVTLYESHRILYSHKLEAAVCCQCTSSSGCDSMKRMNACEINKLAFQNTGCHCRSAAQQKSASACCNSQ